MTTYLIQNNIAHFYCNGIVSVQFPNSETIHTNKHSLNLIESHKVNKVIDVPFKLNTVFVK